MFLGLLLAGPASAHDTWFEPSPNGGLSLGTGNRFPVGEIAVDDKFFVKSGCVAVDGKDVHTRHHHLMDLRFAQPKDAVEEDLLVLGDVGLVGDDLFELLRGRFALLVWSRGAGEESAERRIEPRA